MQKITRRPNGGRSGRKGSPHKAIMRNRHRMSKQASRKKQRKLKRKLGGIVFRIQCGDYRGVRNSPLLRANLEQATKMLTQR